MDNSLEIVKLEELEKRLNSLSKTIKSGNSEIVSLSEYVSMIYEMVKLLRLNVDAIFHTDESFYNYVLKYNISAKTLGAGTVESDRIYFMCTPNVKLLIKVKAELYFENFFSSSDGYFKAFLNTTNQVDGVIYEETYDELPLNTTQTKTIEFTYEFTPTEETNSLLFVVKGLGTLPFFGTSGFNDLEVEIYGYNVIDLTRDNGFKLFTTKTNYYITKNFVDHIEYAKMPIDQVDLLTGFTTLGDFAPGFETSSNPVKVFNGTYVPCVEYNSETDTVSINSEKEMFYICYSYSDQVNYLQINLSSGTANRQNIPIKLGQSYTIGHPYAKTELPYNIGCVNTCLDSRARFRISTHSTESYLKYQNSDILDEHIELVSVFAKDWEDNIGNREPCFLAVMKNLDIWLYNSYNATQRLLVAKGHQVNGFMQSDHSINVYYRWHNNVYKKHLLFNSETGKYTHDSNSEVFENAYEVLEGYGDDYFINKLGTWEYVNPSSSAT